MGYVRKKIEFASLPGFWRRGVALFARQRTLADYAEAEKFVEFRSEISGIVLTVTALYVWGVRDTAAWSVSRVFGFLPQVISPTPPSC
ncbi:MAG TPA: hypothetical protein VG099_03260 [Gemmataceae bacterium]|jgi:hypothetical protein|nr:hypothetical protein [Gemmataceae bacterium]